MNDKHDSIKFRIPHIKKVIARLVDGEGEKDWISGSQPYAPETQMTFEQRLFPASTAYLTVTKDEENKQTGFKEEFQWK